jgi:hypothetical protein
MSRFQAEITEEKLVANLGDLVEPPGRLAPTVNVGAPLEDPAGLPSWRGAGNPAGQHHGVTASRRDNHN